jgi:hypothetical protein
MPEKNTKRKDEIELDPKGWERFERAVDAATKHGPIHRTAPKKRPTKPPHRKRTKAR